MNSDFNKILHEALELQKKGDECMPDFEVGDIVILPRKGGISVMITEIDCNEDDERDEDVPILYSGIRTDTFKYFSGLSADEMVYGGRHVDEYALRRLMKRRDA